MQQGDQGAQGENFTGRSKVQKVGRNQKTKI
jgi:hypothetical protein